MEDLAVVDDSVPAPQTGQVSHVGSASQEGSAPQEDLAAALPALLPRLWRFCLRLARDRHDAEDLLQRACLRALERQHQLRPATATLSWLFSIVHSVWLNEVRARRIRPQASLEWDAPLVETLADDATLTPEMSVLYRQVLAAVDRLPEVQRVVMLLIAAEGLSYREAAFALDIPIGTVMSRLARARLTIGETFRVGERVHP